MRRFLNTAGRLRDESGIALVMAIGIMLVLAIVLASIVQFTSANSRSASYQSADQKAFHLAEAGVNNALAQLRQYYPHYGPPSAVEDPSWATSPGPVPYEGGTAEWSGSYDTTTRVWTIVGLGTVPNPTGPGAANVVRTATAKIAVLREPPPFVRYGLFAGDPNPALACTDLGGGTQLTVAVYVAGCFTVRGGATVTEPSPLSDGEQTVTVNVVRTVQIMGSGVKIGTESQPILHFRAGGGCVGSYPTCQPSPGSQINASEYALTPNPIPMPPVDANEVYGRANWSAASCTGTNPFDNNTSRNNSLGTITFHPSRASFNCTLPVTNPLDGSVETTTFTWNRATKHLHVEGTVFLDGNLHIGNGHGFRWTGNGTIYVNGWVWIQGIVCGPGSTFTPGAESSSVPSNACDPKVWDPDISGQQLMFVAANAAGPLVPGPPYTVSFADPDVDGLSEWAKVPAGPGWDRLNDGVRSPTAPTLGTDRITSSTVGQRQDVGFANSLTFVAGATYRLWVHAGTAGTNRREIRVATSLNDGSSYGGATTLLASNSPEQWVSVDITSLITSQATLDGLRMRLTLERTGGSDSGTGIVNAAYVERAIPTYTHELQSVPGCPAAPCGFWVNSTGAVFEAGAWSIGNFRADANTHMGGSVFADKGHAEILGQGNLKAFRNFPPGSPTLLIYNLAPQASDFG